MRTRVFYNHLTGERTELTEEDMARRYIQNGPSIMPDLDTVYKEGGILSPIDGSFITSRSQLRRHNNTHQVRSAGDFKPGELISKEQSRVAKRRSLAEGGNVKWT